MARGFDTQPLVTVVIPCFNQARFLGEAIESVLRQTHAPTDVIVVDDGSTDGTAAVAAGFAPVRCVRQENRGLPAARNRGLHEAAGEFIVFLDADDRLLPMAVASGVAALSARTDSAFAFGHYRSITEAGRVFREAPPEGLGTDPYCTLLRRNVVGTTAAAIFRTAIVRGVGGFDCTLR
jgi:glycosyltransferase involved in cell wall biosynthesis